jgi:hypothetical protein
MNITTTLLVIALLDLAVIGALAVAVRIAHRLRVAESAETLHPSQPLPFSLYAHEHEEPGQQLAAAA